MTPAERADLATLRTELFARLDVLDNKIDLVEARLDRWDGAVTLVKAAASVLGIGGIGLILAALVRP
jgi:hypothetical protein